MCELTPFCRANVRATGVRLHLERAELLVRPHVQADGGARVAGVVAKGGDAAAWPPRDERIVAASRLAQFG